MTIERLEVRNAVDMQTAAGLADCFRRFESDATLSVAVLTGSGGHFCAGFDLKTLADSPDRLSETGEGPMGPTRMKLTKPVIAAIEGYAVAGGLELALWCDLRVAAGNATFGVFNRRFGVPLIDLGTIRLPRMIGQGRALDLILTGRPVPRRGGAAHRTGGKARRARPRAGEGAAAGTPDRRVPSWCTASRPSQRGEPVVAELRRGRGGDLEAESRSCAQAKREGASRFAKGAGRHGSETGRWPRR